jgi:RNA polymerase sigma-70 factor (ECF subfamily)
VDYSKYDDHSLMRWIAQAEEEALGALYDRYGRLVYSMALNSVGDAELAEEIAQDVFLRVWDKAGTYQPEQGKVLTWITSITRYRAIDMLRRRSARPETVQPGWSTGQENDDDPPEMAAPENVEEQVDLAQQQHRVRKALAQLPQDQQKALAMAFFLGYSHSEIALELGEPLGTVKTRIRLGMQKLKNLLDVE